MSFEQRSRKSLSVLLSFYLPLWNKYKKIQEDYRNTVEILHQLQPCRCYRSAMMVFRRYGNFQGLLMFALLQRIQPRKVIRWHWYVQYPYRSWPQTHQDLTMKIKFSNFLVFVHGSARLWPSKSSQLDKSAYVIQVRWGFWRPSPSSADCEQLVSQVDRGPVLHLCCTLRWGTSSWIRGVIKSEITNASDLGLKRVICSKT